MIKKAIVILLAATSCAFADHHQEKQVNDFVQSEVLLKSGNELIATGTLIKVDDQFCVSIEQVNNVGN